MTSQATLHTALQAFFLPVDSGQRFALFHPAAPGVVKQGQVLYIHPFAEEMNKSRRMAAMQARALAQAGFDVLQLDLLGCGDSSGDFGDATWVAWLHDLNEAYRWLRGGCGDASQPRLPLWLWGLRAGCLLGVDLARQLPEPCNFLFWQPALNGKILLQQFMRLKAAGDLASGNAKAVLEGLRSALAQGGSVEIAGYTVSADLSRGLEQAILSPPPLTASGAAPGRVEWLELSTREDATLSPAATQSIAKWCEAGYSVRGQIVQGPAFWQTTEIEDASALITASLAAVVSLPREDMDAGSGLG